MAKPERQKGMIVIDSDRCKGCGMCTVACPVGIIFLDTTVINAKGYQPATVREMGRCIGCGNCALICPDVAITVLRLDTSIAKNQGRGRKPHRQEKLQRQLPGAA